MSSWIMPSGVVAFLWRPRSKARRFVGIEKNEEVHLFKEQRIDYMEVARLRLAEVETAIEKARKILHPCIQIYNLACKACLGRSAEGAWSTSTQSFAHP